MVQNIYRHHLGPLRSATDKVFKSRKFGIGLKNRPMLFLQPIFNPPPRSVRPLSTQIHIAKCRIFNISGARQKCNWMMPNSNWNYFEASKAAARVVKDNIGKRNWAMSNVYNACWRDCKIAKPVKGVIKENIKTTKTTWERQTKMGKCAKHSDRRFAYLSLCIKILD